MTVMTYDNQPNVIVGPTQLFIVAVIVVLTLAAALTLALALPTVESWHFQNQILQNDLANFAVKI